MPTPVLLHEFDDGQSGTPNKRALIRGNPPYVVLADSPAGCFGCDSVCGHFSNFTPDCVQFGISGITATDEQCECLDGSYYLGWEDCTVNPALGAPVNVCKWSADWPCIIDLPCFGDSAGAATLEAYAWCLPSGFWVGVRIPYWDDLISGGVHHLYHYSKNVGYDLLCSTFSETLTKASWTPSWAPATCTLAGAHGHAVSDLSTLAEFANYSGPCANCGDVASQYQVVITGLPTSTDQGTFCGVDPNGTFALTASDFCTWSGWQYYYTESSPDFCRILLSIGGNPTSGIYVAVYIEYWKNYAGSYVPARAIFRAGPYYTRLDCTSLSLSLSFYSQLRWSGASGGSVTVTAL